MNLYQILVEALNDYEKKYLRSELGGRRYNPEKSHSEMFDSYQDKTNPNRITLPLETTNLNNKVDPQIKFHLKSNGWDVHNYHAGLASRQIKDRDGNDKLEVRKIGKVLQQTDADKVLHSQPRDRLIKGSDGKPVIGSDGRYKSERVNQSLSDFYNTDPIRDSSKSEHNIIISRDLDDIGGMTSGRSWSDDSCMELPKDDYHGNGGGNHDKIEYDLKHHTLVAYATKRGDDDIENPVGRVLIKKYESTKPVDGKYHVIYRPEDTTYGNIPDGFKDQVESLTKKHYPAHLNTHYQLHDDLYDDGRSEIEPSRIGLHTDENGTKHYNSQGQLHDYEDENGDKQPAMDTHEIGHYKNGLLHTDDDTPALISIGLQSHYKNGELHRDNDLPAVYNHDGSHQEYYYGGMLHRANNKPSVLIKKSNYYKEEYHHAGLLHRTDGAASVEQDFSPSSKSPARQTTLWYENGHPLKSETTPYSEKTKDGKIVEQKFNHDNPDKPTSIANYGKGTSLIFGNRKKGLSHSFINLDHTYMDRYEDGVNGVRRGNDSGSIETYNDKLISNIYDGRSKYHVLKTDDNNLHLIDHSNKLGYKLSPDNKITTYHIPDELAYSDGRWYEHNKIMKDIPQKDTNHTKNNLPNIVNKIKTQMYNSEMPTKYTDMIDRFDKVIK